MLVLSAGAAGAAASTSRPAPAGPGGAAEPAPANDFAAAPDLERFRLVAVQHQGRLKTLDTLARETVQEIAGTAFLPRAGGPRGDAAALDPVYVYLDLLFRPERYRDARLFYVKKRPVRQALAQAAEGLAPPEVLEACLGDGRFSLQLLNRPPVRAKLEELHRDVMRTAKDVEALQIGLGLARPDALKQMLRILPPAGSQSVHDSWNDVAGLEMLAANPGPAGISGQAARAAELDPESARILSAAWRQVADGWRAADAGVVSAALNRLASELPLIAPAVYPAHSKLALEHWYYRYHKMTWVWTFYLGAMVFLLMGILYSWRWARRTGAAFFATAFALHTVASGIRWYLAGRIPNSNMFEAVTAAAWFGAAMALVLEAGPALARRRGAWMVGWAAAGGGLLGFLVAVPVAGASYGTWQEWGPVPTAGLVLHTIGVVLLIALAVARRRGSGAGLTLLGASAAGMVALMCGQFLSVELHSDIGTRMPVLNDLWLYIHTNMIIASYALIGIAFVTAAMYVVGRLLVAPTRGLWLSMAMPALLIPLAALAPGISLAVILPAWLPFSIVVVCALGCLAGRVVRDHLLAPRLPGGAGVPGVLSFTGGGMPALAPVGAGPSAAPSPPAAPPRGFALGAVLDGATMVLMELFFIMLWTGIVMGAVWADHSWGRPWGWDPKEVFALNTWIIFLILVHVRLRVREKALWTAVLVVVGTAVMLFNWIVVNFFITGLHSYA
jgi:ABC-type transport system involved in cytochrome c biogenesis permease subunit